MGLNVKLGKGGHGLEVYDEEGKYASEFSFQIGDQTVKGYDDFRSLYFANLAQNSAGQYDAATLEDVYKQNKGFADQIDAQLYDEYNRVLTDAVNEHNAKQVWDTPEEAAKHVHELFVPNFVNNLIQNGILNSDRVSVAKYYEVNILSACLQMSRYPKNRANVISRQEYDNRRKQNLMLGSLGSHSALLTTENYINGAIKEQKDIPLTRNIGGISDGDRANVLASFYDENSPRNSCLSSNGSGYLGSVVYFSTGDYEYSPYSSLTVYGLVRMSDKLKLLQCPLSYYDSSTYACNSSIPELTRFRVEISKDKDFQNRMVNKILEAGVDEADARIITSKVIDRLRSDPGFCAMLMGYDAIWGCGYHFDILNLGICDIVGQ